MSIDEIITVLNSLIPMAEDAIKHPSASSHQQFIQEDKDDIRKAKQLVESLQSLPKEPTPLRDELIRKIVLGYWFYW